MTYPHDALNDFWYNYARMPQGKTIKIKVVEEKEIGEAQESIRAVTNLLKTLINKIKIW